MVSLCVKNCLRTPKGAKTLNILCKLYLLLYMVIDRLEALRLPYDQQFHNGDKPY